MLTTTLLTRRFGGVPAVDDMDLSVSGAKITALIGPNGAGKTTLFNIVTGFDRPDGGAVTFRERRIDRRPASEIARRGLVRTFQTPRPFGTLTVLENFLVAGRRHPGETLLGLCSRWREGRRRERDLLHRASEVLSLVGLENHRDHPAGALSGGQGKLLELGRALMLAPDLLLLDEPVAGVNPALAEKILERMLALRADGMGLLIIEHDMDFVMAAAEHVIVMAEGRLIAQGTPDQVRSDPRVVQAYLGEG
jgi:ABC-type branched-subunit amino acid transport system ATPase component